MIKLKNFSRALLLLGLCTTLRVSHSALAQYATNRPGPIGGNGSVSTNPPGPVTSPVNSSVSDRFPVVADIHGNVVSPTNFQDSAINVIARGLVPDGVTDNSERLSNLLNRGVKSGAVVEFPAVGSGYMLSNSVTVTNSVRLVSHGALLIGGTNVGATNAILRLRGPSSGFDGFVVYDSRTTTNATAFTLDINAIGFPSVKNFTFLNSRGPAIYVHGDSDIFQRSNHWLISDGYFSNYYGAVLEGSNNGTQYGVIARLNGDEGIEYGIRHRNANVVIEDSVMLTGVKGNGPWRGTGLWCEFDTVYTHGGAIRGHYAHWARNVIANISGSKNTALNLGPINFSADFNIISNLNGLRWNGPGLSEAYATNIMAGCSNAIIGPGVDFRGPMLGFTNSSGVPNHTRLGVSQNDVKLPDYSPAAFFGFGGLVSLRTNSFTAADLPASGFGFWNSNGLGSIYVSFNTGGAVTNKAISVP